MIAAETGGSIIFLSSIAGSRVLHPQQQCAYNASKAAVAQLARSLAAEWAPHGIRVNTIAPGYMDTALNREVRSRESGGGSLYPLNIPRVSLHLYAEVTLTRVYLQALLEGQKKHWSAMTPMGRLGRPDELNGLAVFLASDASGFVTGAEILADVS